MNTELRNRRIAATELINQMSDEEFVTVLLANGRDTLMTYNTITIEYKGTSFKIEFSEELGTYVHAGTTLAIRDEVIEDMYAGRFILTLS